MIIIASLRLESHHVAITQTILVSPHPFISIFKHLTPRNWPSAVILRPGYPKTTSHSPLSDNVAIQGQSQGLGAPHLHSLAPVISLPGEATSQLTASNCRVSCEGRRFMASFSQATGLLPAVGLRVAFDLDKNLGQSANMPVGCGRVMMRCTLGFEVTCWEVRHLIAIAPRASGWHYRAKTSGTRYTRQIRDGFCSVVR